jgi:hypothetical protein
LCLKLYVVVILEQLLPVILRSLEVRGKQLHEELRILLLPR